MRSGRNAAEYTVSVVDRTGKAIHTSKTLVSAFREARDTYRAKRAIKAEARQRQLDSYYEQEARKLHHEERRDRHHQRQVESFEIDEERRARHAARRERRRQRERDAAARDQLQSDDSDSTTTTTTTSRTTTRDVYRHSNTSSLTLSSSTNGNDSRGMIGVGGGSIKEVIIPQPSITDDHLTALLLQVSDILDHVSCFGSGVFAMIEALRRDPETLAMVGLTLAEISTIVTKISPGMLVGLKAAWPMVFAFLASPQFAIVAGVGVGTTVVLIGGYKIIKRMGLVGGNATTPAAIGEGVDNEEELFGSLKPSNSFPPRYGDLDLGGHVTGELDMSSLERELPAIEEAPVPTPRAESLRENEVPQLAFDIPKSRPSKSRTKSSRSDHSTSSASSSSRRREKEKHSERERGDREGVRERRRRDHDYDRERISDRSR